ncbi:unnamed protein product [Closterium sp. NIES-64]|nr:unnamed protein product [Closterium sp. NIES-64]
MLIALFGQRVLPLPPFALCCLCCCRRLRWHRVSRRCVCPLQKTPHRQGQGGQGRWRSWRGRWRWWWRRRRGWGGGGGVVAGVGASVAAVEVEAAVAVGVEEAEEAALAAVAEVAAAAVELVGVALCTGATSVAVSASSSSTLMRPAPSSFVSVTLRVSGVGVLVPVPTSCVPATALAAALGGGEAVSLDASASAAPGAGESALSVAVSLADPSGGPVLAHFSTVLRCPAAPSGPFFTSLRSLRTCLLSHQTLLWHHRLGHPSLPRLRGMASHFLVSGLPRSLPPLPPGPAPTCVPCVEGRQRGAPHSSKFPPTEASLQTLHLDMWGPARVRGQGHERYFLLVVDDYLRYTMVFPLRSKGDINEVLIDWIRAAHLQLRESFGSDFPVLHLHSDRGGEFSSDLLRAFCRAQGIRQMFTLPASPHQNGIAERRIGMVMDVACTSMIHAAAPHFLWPFAVQYAAHQINLKPRASLPQTSPTLRWTGKVGDASAFRVWGSQAFVCDLSADKLSPRAFPCVFLGFPPDAPGPPPVDPLPPQDPAPSGVSQVDAVQPVEVAVDSGATWGFEPAGAGSGGAEPGGAESRGAEPGGAEPRGAESGGAEPEGTGPARVESGDSGSGGPSGTSSRRELPSPKELREWFARHWSRAAGAGGAAGGEGSTSAEGACATSLGGARTRGTGAAGPGGAPGAGAGAVESCGGPAGAVTARGVGARGAASAGASEGAGVGAAAAGGATGAGAAALGAGAVPIGSGGFARPRPYFSESQFQPSSPLPASSPYTGPTGGLPERQSSLPALAHPESDSLRAATPTVTRLLATIVTDPSFESTTASALVAELVDFAAHCPLDYVASLVAESESVCPPSVGDIPTPRSYAEVIEGPYSSQWQSAIDAEMASWKSTGTYADEMTTLRVLLHIAAQRDYELHSLHFSIAFLQRSLHEEIWLRRPPGFTGSFPPGTQWILRRPVYGLHQAPREWHDTLRTTLAALGFAPSTADPSLFLRTNTSLPLFYILVYVDDLVFATADTSGLAHVKFELQMRHTCTGLGEVRSYLGLQITQDRAQRTITLSQSHMVQQVL